MTVRPCRSITRDCGPASSRISADVPSADDLPVADRQRFADRRLRIDGDDLAVDQDRVRALRERRARRRADSTRDCPESTHQACHATLRQDEAGCQRDDVNLATPGLRQPTSLAL